MNAVELPAVRVYLAPIEPEYWRWVDDFSAIAWKNGPTITVRQELAIVLSSQTKQGLPPLPAVLVLLAACRDSWPESRRLFGDIVQRTSEAEKFLPGFTPQLFEALDRVHSVSRTLLQSPQSKANLLSYLFEGEANRATTAAVAEAVVNLLGAGGPISQLADIPWVRFDLWKVVNSLRGGLSDFDPQDFESWVRTGLTETIQPAEVELSSGERVRALLDDLQDHRELGGVARLARQLLAASTLPRPLAAPDDLPLGGVSDITNRGALDRLLLSELAHDDLTLAVRVAMNEALYYRRETPPRSPPLRRTIVIDSGLRTWGVPRLFTTAVGLALSAAGDDQLEIQAFRASGSQLVPIDLTRQAGLASHLAALEIDLHPSSALPAIHEELTGHARQVPKGEHPSDLVLITTDDALADDEFRNELRAWEFRGAWIAAINREGRFRLLELGLREMILKREARLDLASVLAPPKYPAKKSTPLYSGDESRPAFCRLQSPPLRIPHDLKIDRIWEIGSEQALSIFKDGRLTWWDDPRFGPRILADNMPERGRVLWAQAGETNSQPPFRAVVGTMSKRGLRAIQVWPEEGKVVCVPLVHDFADQLHSVQATPEHIFLIGSQRVVAFDWMGKLLASSNSFTRQISGLFFEVGGPRFISHVHCDGSRIGLASGYSLPCDSVGKMTMRGKLLVILGSREKPQALTSQGELIDLVQQSICHDFAPDVSFGDWQLGQLSRDNCRAVVRDSRGRTLLVDVERLRCQPFAGEPHSLLEPAFERFLRRPVNLRHHFCGIYVTPRGDLALASTKGQEVTFSLQSQILLRDTGRSQQRAPALRLFEEVEGKESYQLRRASWPDGSEAWLDSRGLVHLRSSNRQVPEMSFVLHEGLTAGWTADGEAFGNRYFLGTEKDVDPPAEARRALQGFLASLVTVETT